MSFPFFRRNPRSSPLLLSPPASPPARPRHRRPPCSSPALRSSPAHPAGPLRSSPPIHSPRSSPMPPPAPFRRKVDFSPLEGMGMAGRLDPAAARSTPRTRQDHTCRQARLSPFPSTLVGECGADEVEIDLTDSGLAFSWPCSRLFELLGETCRTAEMQAPRPCSSEELAAIAKLVELHEIPEAKIWLSASLSEFLYLYTSIPGIGEGSS